VTVLWGMLAFALAGCYSSEEREQAKTYEKQGKINAVNYIEEKYGFEAEVVDAVCEKLGEFDPSPSETVFVTMEWKNKTFLVQIDGDSENTEGVDNYQYEEIVAALEEELEDETGMSSEEVIVVYGVRGEYNSIESNKNGMVATYFDGDNLKEILTGGYSKSAAVVSYINQEIESIDVNAVKEAIGVEELLFVDYDSKAHYKTIEQPWCNLEGTPVEQGIERNLPYINEYLVTNRKETVYVNCEKKIVDGILFVTEYPEETVTVEKRSDFTNGFDKKNSKLVFDVYALETESDIVHVFVPVEALSKTGRNTPGFVVMSGRKDINTVSDLTDDGKYVGATIYTRNYDGSVEFSVYVREE